jgi:hypothetical protein
MKLLTILLIQIKRINLKQNGNIVLEIEPDTASEILYHTLAFTCIIILAMDGRLVNELIKTIAIAYIVKQHGSDDRD